jgi:3-oxoadipate enol-lactonase
VTRILTTSVHGSPRISLAAVGKGEAVVFLHGLGSTKESWYSQLDYVGKTHLAIAWDARGYGESDDYVGELEFARDFVMDLARTLDHVGVARAHLVGLSMGGLIAQCFYFAHPHRVSSLILADSFPSFKSLGEKMVAGFLAARLQPLLDGATPADLAASGAEALLAPGAPDVARKRLIATLSGMRKESYIKTIRAMVAQNAVGRLEDIEVPTLVLNGEFDRLAPVAIAEDMVRRIPDAQLVVIQGAGHLSNLEGPDEFNAAVVTFITAISESQTGCFDSPAEP